MFPPEVQTYSFCPGHWNMSLCGTFWNSSWMVQQRQQNTGNWWEVLCLFDCGSLCNRAAMQIKVYFNSVKLEELTEVIPLLTLCSWSHGVQMLTSHKFEPSDLDKEGSPEWLSPSVATTRGREGQTKKTKQINHNNNMPEKTCHR